ncbi:hypothetical protein M2302_005526 [Micromonospora sp. A200]|nr:hypothetical protein [Micromonospora sp. A200]
MRRVTRGFDTTNRNRSASSGFDFGAIGEDPSADRSRPSGRSFTSASMRTLSALTSREVLRVSSAAICA